MTARKTPVASGWHTPVPDEHAARPLLSSAAVRARCEAVFAHVRAGRSPWFLWHEDALAPTARYVADTVRMRHPTLAVGYHSRWRHFEAGGVDRWDALCRAQGLVGAEAVRVAIDLVIPSVLLDAGAGASWHFEDTAHDLTLARSEGLAVASLALFTAGALSDDSRYPLRADAAALARITAERIGAALQVMPDNPLVGLAGRAALLQRLGEVAAATPAVFGTPARLGNLYDYLHAHADDGRIRASFLLETLLVALGPVWPGRIAIDGVSLGDTWQHPASPDGLVPFHKLTQWLTYSLLEPLEAGGLTVTDLDALTGLPEYRNGGLLLDCGLVTPRDVALMTTPLTVERTEIVEWRALTVAALDRIANAVRAELDLDAARFPLARVLEGGTWAAGRRIAAERRPGGVPPLIIESDGTVF
jgi:hypothetical protein